MAAHAPPTPFPYENVKILGSHWRYCLVFLFGSDCIRVGTCASCITAYSYGMFGLRVVPGLGGVLFAGPHYSAKDSVC